MKVEERKRERAGDHRRSLRGERLKGVPAGGGLSFLLLGFPVPLTCVLFPFCSSSLHILSASCDSAAGKFLHFASHH